MNYTVCFATAKSKVPGLLFETLDVEKVAALPELSTLFSNGYFVTQVGKSNPDSSWYGYGGRPAPPEKKYRTLVSTHLAKQEPDTAPLEGGGVRFFINGAAHSLNLRTRYNQCLSLFKAVGCASCPDLGMKCLSEGVGVELPEQLSPAHEAEDLWDRVRERHPKLGEFTLVKPGATRTDSFSSIIRPYWEHDFNSMEKNAKKRSEASTQGAETKKFKKTQCVKCPINGSCDRSSYCKGAYPPAKNIITRCNAELTKALAASPWPEWQLWEVMRGMGERAKHSRWQIVLSGVVQQGNQGLRATVHRAKGHITEYGKLPLYEDIARVFGLAKTEAAARGPVKDPGIRATLWLALSSPRPHQTYGWGHRRYVFAIGASENYVKLDWTNGRYIVWGTQELYKVSDVASRVTPGKLGDIQKLEVR